MLCSASKSLLVKSFHRNVFRPNGSVHFLSSFFRGLAVPNSAIDYVVRHFVCGPVENRKCFVCAHPIDF